MTNVSEALRDVARLFDELVAMHTAARDDLRQMIVDAGGAPPSRGAELPILVAALEVALQAERAQARADARAAGNWRCVADEVRRRDALARPGASMHDDDVLEVLGHAIASAARS